MKTPSNKQKKSRPVLSCKNALLALTFAAACLPSAAQITITDFESFNLAPASAYNPTNTVSSPFLTFNAAFEHRYDTAYDFWSAGFAYTNIKDSITGDFTNLYGVRAYNGYSNSATWVVGQDRGLIKTTAVPQTTVNGFYITNTTYAYKSMAKGDFVARKFGDTTGTKTGTLYPQGGYPDYFKVIVKGYNNGMLKNDSVTVMLADYTFTNNTQDYILNTWQWVNTDVIGETDSLQFVMRSSDMGQYGINTPLFFAIDNFSASDRGFTALQAYSKKQLEVSVYPNPFNSVVRVVLPEEQIATVNVRDMNGLLLHSVVTGAVENIVDLTALKNGVYLMEIMSGDRQSLKKLIKH